MLLSFLPFSVSLLPTTKRRAPFPQRLLYAPTRLSRRTFFFQAYPATCFTRIGPLRVGSAVFLRHGVCPSLLLFVFLPFPACTKKTLHYRTYTWSEHFRRKQKKKVFITLHFSLTLFHHQRFFIYLPFFNVPPPPIHFFASCVKDFSIFKACSSHFCHLTLLVLSCLCLFAFKFVSLRLFFSLHIISFFFTTKKKRNLFIRMTNISKNRR